MLPKGPSEQVEEVIGAIETHCKALDKAERLCEADEDVIPTMTRRQHGRGHRRQQCRRSVDCCMRRVGFGCAAMPTVTARPSPLCPSLSGGAPTHHPTCCARMHGARSADGVG
jgi:hypothetical protein